MIYYRSVVGYLNIQSYGKNVILVLKEIFESEKLYQLP